MSIMILLDKRPNVMSSYHFKCPFSMVGIVKLCFMTAFAGGAGAGAGETRGGS